MAILRKVQKSDQNHPEPIRNTAYYYFEVVWTRLHASSSSTGSFPVVSHGFSRFWGPGLGCECPSRDWKFLRSPAGILEILKGFSKDLGGSGRIFKGSGRSWEDLEGFSRISASRQAVSLLIFYWSYWFCMSLHRPSQLAGQSAGGVKSINFRRKTGGNFK